MSLTARRHIESHFPPAGGPWRLHSRATATDISSQWQATVLGMGDGATPLATRVRNHRELEMGQGLTPYYGPGRQDTHLWRTRVTVWKYKCSYKRGLALQSSFTPQRRARHEGGEPSTRPVHAARLPTVRGRAEGAHPLGRRACLGRRAPPCRTDTTQHS